MKKLSRMLAALLAAVLLFSCSSALAASYTAPKKLSKVEDLPEMPDVPGMKTKVKTIEGEDIEFITLDGNLEHLLAVWGKATIELNIEDGKVEFEVGALNKKYNCQIGYDTWGGVTDVFPLQWSRAYDATTLIVTNNTTKKQIADWKETANKALADDKPDMTNKYNHLVNKYKDENGRNVRVYLAGQTHMQYNYVKETDPARLAQGTLGEYTEAYWAVDLYEYRTGAKPLIAYGRGNIPGVEYAFEALTEDGVKVLYDRKGRSTARVLTVDDVNIFGTKEAPESTEFVWVLFQNMYGKWVYYLQSIQANYAEGAEYSTITAWYSSNGKLAKAIAK